VLTGWQPDELWERTRLYAARAAREEQAGALFPFWSILALELLGRTVVSSVHPVLLADPQDADNLLYACGVVSLVRPRSVPSATVFRRCVKIVDNFTEADLKGTLGLIELRNEELHSGGTPFEGLRTSAWLADYFRICAVLLRHLGKDLADLFGPEQALAAERMIAAAMEELETEMRSYVAVLARRFQALDEQDWAARREAASRETLRRDNESWAPHQMGSVVPCPACGTEAWMTGELVRSGEPVTDEDAIVYEIIKIPTRLECSACGLEVVGHERLHAIGLGGLFARQFREDPASFFNIEFDASDVDLSEYFEPDYGNE
jgi:hypothetical protein